MATALSLRTRARSAPCAPFVHPAATARPSAPSMGFDLEVQVLPRVDDRDRSEAQLREGDRAWGGSVE